MMETVDIIAVTVMWAFVYSVGFVCGAMWAGLKRTDREDRE